MLDRVTYIFLILRARFDLKKEGSAISNGITSMKRKGNLRGHTLVL